MTCKCGSSRIIKVYAHSRDCNTFLYNDIKFTGYVPGGLGIGASDDIKFEFCAECGQIQNFKAITDSQIHEEFGIFDEDSY